MQPADNVIPMTDARTPSDGSASAPNGGKGARRRKSTINLGAYTTLMEGFALIYGTKTAWDSDNRRIVPVDALRLALTHDAVKAWLASPGRRMVLPEQLVFEPGVEVEPPCINTFGGFAMTPKKGDCGPILELLNYLCSESAPTPEERAAVAAWVLRWLALPLQQPGAKMRSALIFHGPQGAGKNLLFETVAAIYGQYARVVGQDQLESQFNDWASQVLFIIGDEVVARAELYHHKNKLKSFITGQTIQINTKMLPLRTETNHVNVVFLSNEQQPLALEESDRRYLVVWTPPRDDTGLYERVRACLANGGAAAFFEYLRRVPMAYTLGGHQVVFDEFAIPPMTRAKSDLIELGLRPQERFVRDWVGGYLPLPLRVCSTEQLYRAFHRWCRDQGERWPPPQVTFSKGVEKAANKRIRCMPVRLDRPFNGKEWLRLWVPIGCDMVQGQHDSVGHWARECVDAFEDNLRKFHQSSEPAEGGP